MSDNRPTDEIEPLVPEMPRYFGRSDDVAFTSVSTGPDVRPAEERYSIDPLVPDLS